MYIPLLDQNLAKLVRVDIRFQCLPDLTPPSCRKVHPTVEIACRRFRRDCLNLLIAVGAILSQQWSHEVIDSFSLIGAEIFAIRHKVLPFIARQEYGADGDLCFEAELVGGWKEGVGS